MMSEDKIRDESKSNGKDNTPSNFIYDLIDEDIKSGRVSKDDIITRFLRSPMVICILDMPRHC